ncbi:MAG: heavy metal sensor histidine kinase [Glaciimonas sp.]|nr:heavy metal sensor histidine kinase [Glaciimonas sp.]
MKRFRSTSLTARLGLLFALIATLTFAGVGTYLYQSLASQLESHDDIELLGNIGLIRHFLLETSSVQDIQDDPHRFVDVAAGRAGLIIILKSADGKILFQNHTDHGALSTLPVTPANAVPDKASLGRWTLNSKLSARTVSAWGALHNTQEQVQIIVALTDSDRMALLGAYRNEVFAAVFFGALLAALFGYIIVRQGLRALHAIAKQAQSITAQHLDRRLDVTAAPRELQTLLLAFNDMLNRLHRSFQRLSQFSADLAHDLRTPINNLMVQTQVALSKPRSIEDYQTLLASNQEEYERLARMVENMLFLARADHAKFVLNKQRLDASHELQRIADYFEGVAEDAQVRLAIDAGGTLEADPILFRRAVNNLVANALRYTPEGGVIQLAAQTFQEGIAISVANPGIGIKPEHIPLLFDRFYRVDDARSGSTSSTGLGLAIVQSIMMLHGGRVEVESAPDAMTTFRLVFPLVRNHGDLRQPDNAHKINH